MGNSGQSKQVFRQLRHKGKLKKRLDKDPIQSIRKLISKFQDGYPDKVVSGYVRHFSIEPLVIGIWSRVDAEEFHNKAANLPFIQDATASIATNQKRDILYDQSVKTEPVPFLEILTDCLDERPLNICLDGLKKDEEALYGHNNLSVPILAVCDFSWPAIKSLLSRFNLETVPTYLHRCSKILSGKATEEDFNKQCFIHICLSHTMKAFSRKVTKLFKKSIKQDIMFFCSLLANASTLEVFEDVLQHFFIILLFPMETEIFKKSLATLFSDAENMTDFKTLLKFENEEEVRDFLEDENKKEGGNNQAETDLT